MNTREKTLPIVTGISYRKIILLYLMVCFSWSVIGQTSTVFNENFNWSGQYTFKGGEPEMTWHTSYTQANNDRILAYGTSTARSLQIYYQTDATDSGKSYLYGSLTTFSPLFQQQLNLNIGEVVWTYNTRNSKTSYAPHINGLLEFGENNYAQLMVMVASDDDLLDVNTCGYAVLLTRNGSGTTVFKLVRFQGGLNSTDNMTTLVQSAEGVVASTNYASIKVVYAPATDTWSLLVRDNGSTAGTDGLKNPLLEDEVNGYYTTIGSAVDNTHTSVEMTTCAFFYNHGYKGAAGSSKAIFDDFSVQVEAAADVKLSRLAVSLDGTTYTDIVGFDPEKTNYTYYVKKNQPIPLVQTNAEDNHITVNIKQAEHLRNTKEKRTASITATHTSTGLYQEYLVEFIETHNIYMCGMGNANTVTGGSTSAYIPEGWSHNNMYFSGKMEDGNNKFEGIAAAHLLDTATTASLTLPPATEIGLLRFYARKASDEVKGSIRVMLKKDQDAWSEFKNLGDIDSLTYQEFVIPINQQASEQLMVRLDISKNGDEYTSAGYYLDDFSYTAILYKEPVGAPKLTPVVFYLQNLPGERLGTDSDEDIITDLTSAGLLVIPVDCSEYPATSPELEEALVAFHLESLTLLATYENEQRKIDVNRIFYVPEGYRLKKDIPVWNFLEHGADGTLERIMEVFNNSIVPTYNAIPACSPDDLLGPNGEPLDYNLYMDIIYPSGSAENVPLLVNLSSGFPRQGSFAPSKRLEVANRAIFPVGFATTGYAIAFTDYCYNPLARDTHYGIYIENYSLDHWNGLNSNRAYMRYLRKFADMYNLNGKIGVMGISKAAYPATHLLHPLNAQHEERQTFTNTPNTKPQPWEGFRTDVEVGYTAAGLGISEGGLRYIDSLTRPMITSAGRFDENNQWAKYPRSVKQLNDLDINHLTFWMEDMGHSTPCMGVDIATDEKRYQLFKKYFDHYLKPEQQVNLKVFYAYPKAAAGQVDRYGHSRTLPADMLLPDGMDGLSPHAPVTICFLNQIDTTDIHQHIKVIDLQTGIAVPGKWHLRMNNTSLEFEPDQLFEVGKTYALRVEKTIRDIEGKTPEGIFSRTFTVNKSSFDSQEVFFDDFNRIEPAFGGQPVMTYDVNSTSNPSGIVASSDGVLQIYNANDSPGAGTAGSTMIVSSLADYDKLFNQALSANKSSEICWTFNLQSTHADLQGFSNNNNHYAIAAVLVATEANMLSPTCKGYAVTLKNRDGKNAVLALERFDSGFESDLGFTVLSTTSEGIGTNHVSVKVIYEPQTNNWRMYYRIDGASFNNPAVETEQHAYVSSAKNDVKDDIYTTTSMHHFGFLMTHGNTIQGINAKARLDNFRVYLTAESSDATLRDLSVSLDGNNYNSLMRFDPQQTSYQYYLTKGHPLPTVSASSFHSKALDPAIVNPSNLQGNITERSAFVTVVAEDGYAAVYTIEFIETDNVYISGMGNANGTTSGGASSLYIPEGWSHSGMYFSGIFGNGNNKFEGYASVRCGLSSTNSSLTLPPMKTIGTLRFYARKYEAGVVGNIRILTQIDGGDWTEACNLGDIESLTYQEFVVPINQIANTSMLARVEITKNGDTFSSAGYYFDDFSYTAYGDETLVREQYQQSDFLIKKLEDGVIVQVENALINIYSISGVLLNCKDVIGSHKFKLVSTGTYIIQALTNKGSSIKKYVH